MRNLTNSPEWEKVSAWEALIQKWEAAYTSYRTSLQAISIVEGDDGIAAECRAANAVALAELTETRVQIDALIAESRASRVPLTDTLKVRTIYHRSIMTFVSDVQLEQAAAE